MLNIGPPELLLIFVIALVIVGPQRLPELGRTIGKGLREFRKMQDEVKDLVNTGMGDDLKQTTAELRRTASDLKSATDVRSAFRNDAPRTRPHAPTARGGAQAAPAVSPASDTSAPATPGPDAAGPATTPLDESGPDESGPDA
jgi:Tat protein translocase TatB subunit